MSEVECDSHRCYRANASARAINKVNLLVALVALLILFVLRYARNCNLHTAAKEPQEVSAKIHHGLTSMLSRPHSKALHCAHSINHTIYFHPLCYCGGGMSPPAAASSTSIHINFVSIFGHQTVGNTFNYRSRLLILLRWLLILISRSEEHSVRTWRLGIHEGGQGA